MFSSARQTGFVGSLNDESPAGSVDELCCVMVFQPGFPARLRRPRMAGIAREVRTRRVRSKRVQPGTAAREKGRSSMFLIYSFAASKEGNTFKNSKLLTGAELCQVLCDDGCF